MLRAVKKIKVLKNKSVLILAGHSEIGMAIARRFAKAGRSVQLAGRNVKNLEADQADIVLRYGVSVTLHEFDALNINSHTLFVDQLPELPSIAVCAVGLMGSQSDSEQTPDAAISVIRSNYEGPVSIMSILANLFGERGEGTLIGISSVAGERGRATNYVYGSAKAGFTTYLSGLRSRLNNKGVHVLTVLPGFVYTKMTKNMVLPPQLTAEPKELAEAIFWATSKNKNVIYFYPIWRLIMLVIKLLPESLFKRLKI